MGGAVIDVCEIHLLDFFHGVFSSYFSHVDHSNIVREGDVSILVVEVEVEQHVGVETIRELATVVAEVHARHGIDQVIECEGGSPVSADEVGSDRHFGFVPIVSTVVGGDGGFSQDAKQSVMAMNAIAKMFFFILF